MIRRHLLIACALLAPSLALAANYGSPEACSLYARGGESAVYTGGATIYTADELAAFTVASAQGAAETDVFFVSPTQVLAVELICEIGQYTGNRAALSCYGEGEEWTSTATILEVDDALLYTDENGPVVLRRC